jgi:hypothetical protein
MNALNPDLLSVPERLDEIAELLAAALMRLRQRKSRSISGDRGESRLDFSIHQRGHASRQDLPEDAS